MFKTLKIESSTYRVPMAIATRIEHLQRCIAAFEADKKYERAEKCRQHIYDIMDKALFDLEAYEVDGGEVA